MNKQQKTVFWLAILVIALMGVFPPWKRTILATGEMLERAGYHLIIAGPGRTSYAVGVSVDFARLLIQWIAVAFGAVALLAVLKGDEEE